MRVSCSLLNIKCALSKARKNITDKKPKWKLGMDSTQNKILIENYDGIFFYPKFEEFIHTDYRIELFSFNDETLKSEKIEHTELGDKYYIAFFKFHEEKILDLDECFEAIFIDPLTYIKNLVGSNFYGCMVRKTKTSGEWFKGMLKSFQESANTVTETQE